MTSSRPIRSLLTLIIGLALLAAACGDSANGESARSTKAAASSASGTSARHVTVEATGEARGVPDQLVARLAVHASAPTAAAVLSDANVRAQAVLDQLKKVGIDAKDVRTTQVNLGPSFDKKGNITGFVADNTIEITFRKLSVAGKQLDAVVRTPGDAARLQSVSLGFNDDDKLLAAARADAVRRAQAQAKEMLGEVGADLGAVRTITETAAPQPYAAASQARLATSDSSVPIAPGTQELTVTVRVVFEIA